MRVRSVMVLVLFLAAVGEASATFIFESATLGETGIDPSNGVFVDELQFVGVRFEVDSTVTTGSLGGHFFGVGTLFGAIVSLSGPGDFPDSMDLSTSDVLGATVLAATLPSSEASADIGILLTPGWYALVFGSELFGASGIALLPMVTLNPDIGYDSDIGTPSYFYRNAPGYSDGGFTGTRFFLTAVPEPSSLLLLVMGLAGLAKASPIAHRPA